MKRASIHSTEMAGDVDDEILSRNCVGDSTRPQRKSNDPGGQGSDFVTARWPPNELRNYVTFKTTLSQNVLFLQDLALCSNFTPRPLQGTNSDSILASHLAHGK